MNKHKQKEEKMITSILKDITLTTKTKEIYLGSETFTNQNNMKRKISHYEWKVPNGTYNVSITIGGNDKDFVKEILATFTPGNNKNTSNFHIIREGLANSLTLNFVIRNESSSDGTLRILSSASRQASFKMHAIMKKHDVLY